MKSHFFHFLYFGFFSWFCIAGPLHPIANYDMLPYVGSVLSYTDDTKVREHSLAEIKKYVSIEQYNTFISGSYYKEKVANDDRAFIEQLPGYRVKPLYILLIRFLGKAIENIPLASVIISSVGFFLIGIALFLLRPKGLFESLWLILIPFVLYIGTPTFTLLPAVSSPDSLATGLILMSVWTFLRKPQSVYSIILMSLAILSRPDSIITIICFFPILIKMYSDRILNARWVTWAVAVPVMVYLLNKKFFPSFGVKELIIFASKGPFPYLASIDTSQFTEIYLSMLYKDIVSLIALPRFILFLIANIAFIYFCKNSYSKIILVAALGNIVIKILLFPNFDGGFGERFFFVSYFLILVSIFNKFQIPAKEEVVEMAKHQRSQLFP